VFAILIGAACASGGDGASGLDGSLVAQGEPLYHQTCAACHGTSGEGLGGDWKVRGPDGALPPPPHDAGGHTWHHADGLLLRIVREGCGLYSTGGTPCNMPAFGDRLDDAQIRAVLEYIKTFWGPDERAFQAEVSLSDPFPSQ
jgi:mono/diheme cytochrome c family protein